MCVCRALCNNAGGQEKNNRIKICLLALPHRTKRHTCTEACKSGLFLLAQQNKLTKQFQTSIGLITGLDCEIFYSKGMKVVCVANEWIN